MRILLHPGVPKAASTSLQQQYFSRLKAPDYFAGKAAPAADGSPLYRCVTDAVQSPADAFSADRSRLHVERELERLRGVRTVVLSDEMYLVDTATVDWQTRLGRLGSLMNGHQLSLVLIVREPVRAAYSLLVELWNTLPTRDRDLERFLLSGNQARIYNYGYLDDLLSAGFPSAERIYFSFEELVAPGGFGRFLNRLDLSVEEARTPEGLNPKARGDRGYIASAPSLRTMLLRRGPVRSILARIPRRWYAEAAGVLDRIRLPGAVEVEFPDPGLVDRYYSAMKRDLDKFEENTGIVFARQFHTETEPRDG